jgi:hypothetical protein
VTAVLVLVAGCARTYDVRLNRTLDDMKYRKKLDYFLNPAPTQGAWAGLSIYLRPPKPLQEAKEFQLTVLEQPGQYDLASSFLETQSKESLHVLARKKQPKTTAKKKAPTPADTAVRGDFTSDVLALVNNVYGSELKIDKKKPEEKKRSNSFQHLLAAPGDGTKTIQVYLYKNDPYDVALIFEYPTAEQANLAAPITFCLESLAVGKRAATLLQDPTQVSEEEAPAPGAGVAF